MKDATQTTNTQYKYVYAEYKHVYAEYKHVYPVRRGGCEQRALKGVESHTLVDTGVCVADQGTTPAGYDTSRIRHRYDQV